MTKRFIVVAGNIGSGKTSITERIGARLGRRTAFESVADNPYLPEFYAYMRRVVLSPAGLLPGPSCRAAPGPGERGRFGDP